jgi:hypothetical protein
LAACEVNPTPSTTAAKAQNRFVVFISKPDLIYFDHIKRLGRPVSSGIGHFFHLFSKRGQSQRRPNAGDAVVRRATMRDAQPSKLEVRVDFQFTRLICLSRFGHSPATTAVIRFVQILDQI